MLGGSAITARSAGTGYPMPAAWFASEDESDVVQYLKRRVGLA